MPKLPDTLGAILHIDRIDFPGKYFTPEIDAAAFAPRSLEEMLKASREAEQKALAYRKTWRGAIEHWIWFGRYLLARWIDPDV